MAKLDLQAAIEESLIPVAEGAASIDDETISKETKRIVKSMAIKRQELAKINNRGVLGKLWGLIGSTTSLVTTGLYVANTLAEAEATVLTATYEEDRMLSSLKDRLELLKQLEA